MSLTDELKNMHQQINNSIPELAAGFDRDTDQAIADGIGSDSLKAGSTAPDFVLNDQLGRPVDSTKLREKAQSIYKFLPWQLVPLL